MRKMSSGSTALLNRDTLVQPKLYQASQVHAQTLGCPVPSTAPAHTWHGLNPPPTLLSTIETMDFQEKVTEPRWPKDTATLVLSALSSSLWPKPWSLPNPDDSETHAALPTIPILWFSLLVWVLASQQAWLLFVHLLVVLRPWSLHTLGKHSTPDQYPHAFKKSF